MKMKLSCWSVAFVMGTVVVLAAASAAQTSFPTTAKKTVSDTYHGVTVLEDYRWLENPGDPAVKEWVARQNAYTRTTLDKVPARPSIAKALQKLLATESESYGSLIQRPGLLFAIKYQPPKQQPFIITRRSAEDSLSERVVVDPNALDTTGRISMDFFVPSLDGRLVSVSLSKGGSEDGTVHIFDVATGKELPDQVPHVNYPTAGGSVAWSPDNKGFYYTRYPQKGERDDKDLHFYQQVYYHTLGTPLTDDKYAIGKEFPRIAEIELETSRDGKYVLATASNGDGGEYSHYLLGPSGAWVQVTKFSDKITRAEFGLDQALYLLSLNGSPRGKILRLPLGDPELSKTKVVVPEMDGTIQGLTATASKLYVSELYGGPSELKVCNLDGSNVVTVPTEKISSVGAPVWLEGDEVLFNVQSYVTPSTWFHFDPSAGAATKSSLTRPVPVNFDDAEVTREFATSKDGTKVPLNIIRKKGIVLDGSNPTILNAYGGYSISLSPGFSKTDRLWLDQGGIFVVANLRGGGEYGEEWHRAGNLTKKQNVFDDFAAAAKFLIDNKYTSVEKLAIQGGSNGGLLMGAALTQHPELYRAVVTSVGIYDMLRVELSPNGEFNTTEFGTVKDKAQFEALYAYSPYHHVKNGTAYPAVLLVAGDNDGRVDPANSRKMTARLQEATSSGHPIFLRTSSTAGHGIGTSLGERIEQEADVFAFLFDQLGMMYK